MQVKFKKTFLKDYSKLPDDKKMKIGEVVFQTVPSVNNFKELRNIKKIKGSANYYRIRVGDYRIGFEYFEKTITFYRVLLRRDIYKFFP